MNNSGRDPDKPGGSSEGMGASPSGPAFRSPGADSQPGSVPAQPRSHGAAQDWTEAYRPTRSKVPVLVTAGLLCLVVLIVAAASLAASVNDRTVTATAPREKQARPAPSASRDAIDFTSDEGSGTLLVVAHQWVSGGAEPASSGSFLQIEVELVSSEGEISYDPYFFQAFDAQGELFDTTELGAKDPLLGMGTLKPGERARGFISFDMPRGDVTLLLSNANAESVTALKIQD